MRGSSLRRERSDGTILSLLINLCVLFRRFRMIIRCVHRVLVNRANIRERHGLARGVNVNVKMVNCIGTRLLVHNVRKRKLVIRVTNGTALYRLNSSIITLLDNSTQRPNGVRVTKKNVTDTVVERHLRARKNRYLIMRNSSHPTTLRRDQMTLGLRRAGNNNRVNRITLVPDTRGVVFPHTRLNFNRNVLTLAIRKWRLRLLMRRFIVRALGIAPNRNTALNNNGVLRHVRKRKKGVHRATGLLPVVFNAGKINHVHRGRRTTGHNL